jgi:acyl CoA:acetate/3-ketoacid CoA transferase alpha subunit
VVEIATPADAVCRIGPGDTVAIGGSLTAGHPMALVRALIRARTGDLTVVGGLTAGLELDILVAAGLVARLVAPYVGGEDIAPLPPAIRWAVERGDDIEVWETDEGIHLASLRAHAQRVPHTTWAGGVGTIVGASPLVETVLEDDQPAYLKVRPLPVDVALVWAEAADVDGNILLWGPDFGDAALRNAAHHRIVQVERIVPTDVLAAARDRVVPWQADTLVRAPLSTHPFASSAIDCDQAWLTAYVDVVRGARSRNARSDIRIFLEEWVTACPDEDSYLARVGIARLRELLR